MNQEAWRKDVERAFGVLQARFAILSAPARLRRNKDLDKIMKACIIMHNMIVEDERDSYSKNYEYHNRYSANPSSAAVISRDLENQSSADFLKRRGEMRNSQEHKRLRDSLVKHLWLKKGGYETLR